MPRLFKKSDQAKITNRGTGTETDEQSAELPSYQEREPLESSELPSYQESVPVGAGPSGKASSGKGLSERIPTISSPFDFPKSDSLPDYQLSQAGASTTKIIAIPQIYPEQAAPFLKAYAPSLLKYGIPDTTWYSFLDTISAFLTAKVSKRAISHAGDIAQQVGKVPTLLGKETYRHAKSIVTDIGSSAKRFDVFGVVGGVIGGTVELVMGTTGRIIGSTLAIPATAIVAAANPKTPRDRVQAYAIAANKDWLGPRGLYLLCLNTVELCELLGIASSTLIQIINSQPGDIASKIASLKEYIEHLEVNSMELKQESKLPVLEASMNEPTKLVQENNPPVPEYSASESSGKKLKKDKGKATVGEARGYQSFHFLEVTNDTLWLVVRKNQV